MADCLAQGLLAHGGGCTHLRIGGGDARGFVALEEEEVKGYLLYKGLIIALAEADHDAGTGELAPLLYPTAVAVEDPGLGDGLLLAQGEKLIDALDAVDEEGLAHKLAEVYVFAHDIYL